MKLININNDDYINTNYSKNTMNNTNNSNNTNK